MELTLSSETTPRQKGFLNYMRLKGECCDARIVSSNDFVGTESFALGVHCCILFAASPVLYGRFTELTHRHIKKGLKWRYRISSPGISKEVWFLVLDYIYLGTVTLTESCSFEEISSFASVLNSLQIVQESDFDKIKKHLMSHSKYEELLKATEDPLTKMNDIVDVYMGPLTREESSEKSDDPQNSGLKMKSKSLEVDEKKQVLKRKKLPRKVKSLQPMFSGSFSEGGGTTKDWVAMRKQRTRKINLKAILMNCEKSERPKEIKRHACPTCGKSFFMAQSLQKHQCDGAGGNIGGNKEKYVMPDELFVSSTGALLSPQFGAEGNTAVQRAVTKRDLDSSAPNKPAQEISGKKTINVVIKEEPIDGGYVEQDRSSDINTEPEILRGIVEQQAVPIKIEPIEEYDQSGAVKSFEEHRLKTKYPERSMNKLDINLVSKAVGNKNISSVDNVIFPSMENINILLEEHRQSASKETVTEDGSSETAAKVSSVLNVIDSIDSDIKLSPGVSDYRESQGPRLSVLNVIDSIDSVHRVEASPGTQKLHDVSADVSSRYTKLSPKTTEGQKVVIDEAIIGADENAEQNVKCQQEEAIMSKQFEGKMGVKRIVDPGKGAAYSCPMCNRNFFMFVSLARHKCQKANDDKEKKYYKCLCCNIFVRSSEVQNHVFPEGETTGMTGKDPIKIMKPSDRSSNSNHPVTGIRNRPTGKGMAKSNMKKNCSTDRASNGTASHVLSTPTNMKLNKSRDNSAETVTSNRKPVQGGVGNMTEKQGSTGAHTRLMGKVKSPMNVPSSESGKFGSVLKNTKLDSGMGISKVRTNSDKSKHGVTSAELFARLEHSVKKANFPFTKITVVSPKKIVMSSEKGNSNNEADSGESTGNPGEVQKTKLLNKPFIKRTPTELLPTVSLKKMSHAAITTSMVESVPRSSTKGVLETKGDQMRSRSSIKRIDLGKKDADVTSLAISKGNHRGALQKHPLVVLERMSQRETASTNKDVKDNINTAQFKSKRKCSDVCPVPNKTAKNIDSTVKARRACTMKKDESVS